ncbi:MAG: HDOD domain-containing protein [Kofleriaceae bacterium]|nr:HDOD domain-containing protein [Kofleriaceae bacterium]
MRTNREAAARSKARRHLERSIDELPVLPTVVAQLMVLDKDAEDFFDELLDLVQADPNFSARVLASANSSALGGKASIGTVRAALTRLGSSNVSAQLLASSKFVYSPS